MVGTLSLEIPDRMITLATESVAIGAWTVEETNHLLMTMNTMEENLDIFWGTVCAKKRSNFEVRNF